MLATHCVVRRIMPSIFRLRTFVLPYWKPAALSLTALTCLVFLDLAIPRLVQELIDLGIQRHDQAEVLRLGAIMLGVTALSAIISIGNNYWSVRVGEGVARDLREALFICIQNYSYGNLDEQKTGLLMVRLTSDVSAFQRLIQVSLRIGTRAPLLMVGSLILMVSTSPSLAVTLFPLLLVTAVLIVTFVSKTEPLFRTVQQRLDKLNTVLQENVAGARLVKAFVRQDFEGQQFDRANEDLSARSTRVMQLMSTMTPILTMCVNVGMYIVLWFGGQSAVRGDMTVGQVVAFTNYLLTTMTPLIMMTQLAQTWASGIASGNRALLVLETVPMVKDAPDAKTLNSSISGRIEFENVTFRYHQENEQPVLSSVSFIAEPGQSVALLGATGAGKTTLANLVPRFYDPICGRILLDGTDIRSIKQDSVLQHIAIVPQESILFSGTVADNIRYGRPGATDDAVEAAARAAQAHGFISLLPNGYHSHIEERGVNLSGGQKQRVAIARALLMQPRILILDDSTSAVDVDTETKIQRELDAQIGSHTSLIIAQRISTVLKADKIVVLDQGMVAAEGTHDGLLTTSAIYREIYDSQLGGGPQIQPAVHPGRTVEVLN